MGYSGANEARNARQSLGGALEALQREADVPREVLAITENVARSIGALFEAEHASTEPDGKTCVKSALGTLSQTLALLQDVKSEHNGVLAATENIADVISILFPLTNRRSTRPDSDGATHPASASPPPKPSDPPVAVVRSPSGAMPAQPSSRPARDAPSERPISSRPLSGAPLSSRPAAPAREAPSKRPAPKRPGSDAPFPSRPAAPVSEAPSQRPTSRPALGGRPIGSQPAAPASNAPSERRVAGRPLRSAPVSLPSAKAQPSAPIPTSMLPPPAPLPVGKRRWIEANLGATTQSNFYVGFSGEIAHGGVFLATYESLAKDTSVTMLVTLPGGFEFECEGYVRFVRDPMDFASESEPGMGIQFESLSDNARELALRFVRQRPPMFYDV